MASNIREALIGGVVCTVHAGLTTASAIVCTAGRRDAHVAPSTISVVFPSLGAAVIAPNATFTYVDRWSSLDTWGGAAPPAEGDSVVIPPGQNILLDVSPPRLNLILVLGRLAVEDARDVNIDASYIFVRGGSFAVGTESAPFTHKAVITLHGTPKVTPELPGYGAKNIAVRRGVLDLHGAPVTPTWTQLARTAHAGATSIDLAHGAVSWQPGDEIVIASSSFDMEEAEKMTIASVAAAAGSGPSVVTLTAPLKFAHFAEVVSYGGKEIDMRAEVGHLTRRVVVRGDDSSERHKWGAHIMLHSPGDESTVGRLSYVECHLCGQAFNLGRYPIHFHMIGAVRKSYVKGCAVHRTFNRAVTIHGVHHFRVLDNVAYDNMGHAFFIEDAAETHNRVEGNLGLVTRASSSLLDTDTTPATFWITHPTNYFVGNVAAGSERYGFWFDLQRFATGPSADERVCPPGSPLGSFVNNRAHSNGRYGLRIFNHWVPRANPCDWQSAVSEANPLVGTDG